MLFTSYERLWYGRDQGTDTPWKTVSLERHILAREVLSISYMQYHVMVCRQGGCGDRTCLQVLIPNIFQQTPQPYLQSSSAFYAG